MNISPLVNTPQVKTVRSLLVAAIATTLTASAVIGFSSPASAGEAQTATNAPIFSVEASAKRAVNKGVTAYLKGDYSKASAYNRNALHQGLKKSHKTVVYSNQCATLGAQGRLDDALVACDNALELSPNNWQAFSNRAAINWLNGNTQQAHLDIKAAQNLDANASDVLYNIKVFG